MTTRTVSGLLRQAQQPIVAWDALRRLTSVTKGAAVTSFVYPSTCSGRRDADGQRLLRKTGEWAAGRSLRIATLIGGLMAFARRCR